MGALGGRGSEGRGKRRKTETVNNHERFFDNDRGKKQTKKPKYQPYIPHAGTKVFQSLPFQGKAHFAVQPRKMRKKEHHDIERVCDQGNL